MKKMIVTAAVLVAALVIACESTQPKTESQTAEVKKDSLKEMTSEERIARGEYLVNTLGCDDCHSPKKMGPHGPELVEGRRFSGYPADQPLAPIDPANLKNGWVLMGPDLTRSVGPWGASFSANITSDATGIGNWTEAQFFKAIREGKSKGLDGGRMLLPPMPWPGYSKLTDEDLKSIFAFLKTTQPVENVVPAPIPPDQLFKK